MTRDEILRMEGRELDDSLGKALDIPKPAYLSVAWIGMGWVIERMRAKGWRLELLGYLRGNFAARFMGEGQGESKLGPSVDADDAPRAVALAALLALESHETQDPR